MTAEYQGAASRGHNDLMNILGGSFARGGEPPGGLKSNGKTAVLVALDQAAIGILGIADSLRQRRRNGAQSNAAVKRVLMLTGDDRRTAEAIASQADITEV